MKGDGKRREKDASFNEYKSVISSTAEISLIIINTISVMIGSPIVQIWLPRADLGSACKLAPQSPGLPQTKRLSTRVSWSILKLREVSSLSMGTIYSFQKRSSDQTYLNKHKQI